MRPAVLALGLVALAAAAPARAQAVATVDEGAFAISRAGSRVGREEFRIRRTPTGESEANYVASATVTLAGRQTAPDLRTDARGVPLAYRVEVRNGTSMEERFRGAVERGLFTAVVSTPRGESSREYVVSDGAVLVDDDVFHQYYFVARHAGAGSVSVVVPRRGAELRMQVEARGSEPLSVAGSTVAATHLVLHEPGGATRDVWLDQSGRVLKVAVPGTGLTAEREQLPR